MKTNVYLFRRNTHSSIFESINGPPSPRPQCGGFPQEAEQHHGSPSQEELLNVPNFRRYEIKYWIAQTQLKETKERVKDKGQQETTVRLNKFKHRTLFYKKYNLINVRILFCQLLKCIIHRDFSFQQRSYSINTPSVCLSGFGGNVIFSTPN